MSKRLKAGYKNLKKPLYLNANLIFSTAYCRINKKQNTTLNKLCGSGYNLVVSSLVKYEVIINLMNDDRTRLNLNEARELYSTIIEEYKIMEITSLHKHNLLTDDFMERILTSKVTFKDGLHFEIARIYNNMPVCTHDQEMRQSSTHEAKKKFYENVYKPQELIKPSEDRAKK